VRITEDRVKQFRDAALRAHARPTARKVLAAFKTVLRREKRGHLAIEVKIEARGREKRKLKAGREFPLPTHVKAMIDTAGPKARAAVCLAGLAGLRASELRALPWANVNLGDNKPSVTVEQRADRWSRIGNPKSEDSHREIPLGEVAINALKEWKLAQPHGRTLIFGTASDKPDMLGNLQKRLLTPLCASAGVPRYSWHALRHYAISTWLETCGGNFKLVQTWAGHGTLSQTLERYGHLIPRAGDHDVIALAEAHIK
jgi:integrase